MFEGANLKLDRADHHVRDFQATFEASIQSNPYEIVLNNDVGARFHTLEVKFREPIPTSLALILADAIHNLRAALDHATWELVGLDGGPRIDGLLFQPGSSSGITRPRVME